MHMIVFIAVLMYKPFGKLIWIVIPYAKGGV